MAPLGTYYYIVLSQMSTSTSKCYIAVYFKAKWRCSCGPSWAKTHRYTFIYLHLSLEDVTHIPSCTRFLSRRQYTNNTQRLHLSLFLSFFLSLSLSPLLKNENQSMLSSRAKKFKHSNILNTFHQKIPSTAFYLLDTLLTF